MSVEILTPPGRIVMGSVSEPNRKDAEGKPLIIKNGVNAGKPREDYFIGLAIPKSNADYQALYQTIMGVAATEFPNLFNGGECINPNFAFKITDGDSTVPNSKGVKPCDRTGFPGHWVLSFNNGFEPECYRKGGTAKITDLSEIKRGYWVRIYGHVKGNESTQQPGIFLNHRYIELLGYDEEITSGASGEQIFSSSPVEGLPSHVSATPMAPNTTLSPTQPMPVAPIPAQPSDFLSPDATQVKYKTPDGQTWTAEQLRSQGYSDDLISRMPKA